MSDAAAHLIAPGAPDESITNGFVNPIDAFNYVSPSAWINVVGLAVMIFNLLYVNFVSTGLHSYAGVS